MAMGGGCKKGAPAPRDDTAVGGAGEGSHQLFVTRGYCPAPLTLVTPLVGVGFLAHVRRFPT